MISRTAFCSAQPATIFEARQLTRGRLRERGQGGDPPRHDFAVGRHPVVGQAVPGRQGQDGNVGVEEGQAFGEACHARVVARDVEDAGTRLRGLTDDDGIDARGRPGNLAAAGPLQEFC